MTFGPKDATIRSVEERIAALMVRIIGTHSLDDFKSNVMEHLRRLRETGQPEFLSIDGKTELIIQDARAYERLLELADRAEAIEGIKRGLESMKRGEGRPAREALEEIRRKHGIPRDV